jgi:adenosine deaminase
MARFPFSRLSTLVILLGAVFAANIPTAQAAVETDEVRTAKYFDAIRNDPTELQIFLRRMPKGGDLHNHLSGAIYVESMIDWAVQDGICVRLTPLAFAKPPCMSDQGTVPAAEFTKSSSNTRRLIDALSMRDFVATPDHSGHDQFFDSFDRFNAALTHHKADMVVDAVNQAAHDRLIYVEFMDSPGMDEARAIGRDIELGDDINLFLDQALPALDELVSKTKARMNALDQDVQQKLKCKTPMAAAGCAITVRYLAQVIRTFPPREVFAQAAFGYLLAQADDHFVGLNFVAPEDDPIAVHDYDAHMRVLNSLGKRFPSVKLSLHAGEVWPGLVAPDALRHHIHDAVTMAGARRIGHGVDIGFEDDAVQTLADMAAKKILVEINLTSNDGILGVRGSAHPLMTYYKSRVPLALSTDDEGVSRIDLTHEIHRAVTTYPLRYRDLKAMVRNSLEYAFVPGDSLWLQTAPYQLRPECQQKNAPICQAFLAKSTRAQLQMTLEDLFIQFEAETPRAKRY